MKKNVQFFTQLVKKVAIAWVKLVTIKSAHCPNVCNAGVVFGEN